MRISDWSSDVCSSDLVHEPHQTQGFDPGFKVGKVEPFLGAVQPLHRKAQQPLARCAAPFDLRAPAFLYPGVVHHRQQCFGRALDDADMLAPGAAMERRPTAISRTSAVSGTRVSVAV